MGQNLALNIADHGFKISVYNRTTSKMEEFVAANPDTRAASSDATASKTLSHRCNARAKSSFWYKPVGQLTKSSKAWSRCWKKATSSSMEATRSGTTPSAARKS